MNAAVGALASRLAPGPRARSFAIGVAACAAVALVALGLARIAGIPSVLAALALGMAARRWGVQAQGRAGVDFCARTLLRLAVALIGVRLSFGEVAGLGWSVVGIAVGAVAVTVLGGALIGRACGLSPERSVLSAGATGICGASAALAISSVLPQTPERQRETVFTVAAVTTLSTVVMLLYPLLAGWAGLDETRAGIFFGAAIHDVVQVVGAGELVSPHAATTATATKLVRVACLAPAAIFIGLWAARRAGAKQGSGKPSAPLVPLFLIGFAVLAVLANSGWLGRDLIGLLSGAATACMVLAIAALGVKTSIRDLVGAGWRPLLAAVLQTVLIGVYAFGAVWLIA